MSVVVQNQRSRSFNRLSDHPLCILWIDTQFDTCLHGCLNVLQYIRNAARCQGRSCCHLLFGNQHRQAHFVEDVQHQLFLLLRGMMACDERHAFQLRDSGIGNHPEDAHLLSYPTFELFERNASRNGYQHLLFCIKRKFFHHLFDVPRLHCQHYHVGILCSFHIVVCHLYGREFRFQGIELSLTRIGHIDVLCLYDGSFRQTTGYGSPHVSGSYDCYFHMAINLFRHGLHGFHGY